MIRVQKRFIFQQTDRGIILRSSPYKRIQFGISALILLGGLVAGYLSGGLVNIDPLGILFYFFLVGVCLWVAGSKLILDFDARSRKISREKWLFGMLRYGYETMDYGQDAEIRVVNIGLFKDGYKPEGSDFRSLQKASKARYLCKLLVVNQAQELYIDESSSPEEIYSMAGAISAATGLRIERQD